MELNHMIQMQEGVEKLHVCFQEGEVALFFLFFFFFFKKKKLHEEGGKPTGYSHVLQFDCC